MNSINFVKGKNENWIYLITDGSDTLKEDKSNGIKVFYNDGTLQATESMADYYEGYLKDIANKNDWTAFDSLLQSVDFCIL